MAVSFVEAASVQVQGELGGEAKEEVGDKGRRRIVRPIEEARARLHRVVTVAQEGKPLGVESAHLRMIGDR